MKLTLKGLTEALEGSDAGKGLKWLQTHLPAPAVSAPVDPEAVAPTATPAPQAPVPTPAPVHQAPAAPAAKPDWKKTPWPLAFGNKVLWPLFEETGINPYSDRAWEIASLIWDSIPEEAPAAPLPARRTGPTPTRPTPAPAAPAAATEDVIEITVEEILAEFGVDSTPQSRDNIAANIPSGDKAIPLGDAHKPHIMRKGKRGAICSECKQAVDRRAVVCPHCSAAFA